MFVKSSAEYRTNKGMSLKKRKTMKETMRLSTEANETLANHLMSIQVG